MVLVGGSDFKVAGGEREAVNLYRFNGKEFVEEIGLYEYGFRWYDPAIGRFTGVDPVSDQFAWVSVYNYAENDPVVNIDLHGLQKVNVNAIGILETTSKSGNFQKTVAASFTYNTNASTFNLAVTVDGKVVIATNQFGKLEVASLNTKQLESDVTGAIFAQEGVGLDIGNAAGLGTDAMRDIADGMRAEEGLSLLNETANDISANVIDMVADDVDRGSERVILDTKTETTINSKGETIKTGPAVKLTPANTISVQLTENKRVEAAVSVSISPQTCTSCNEKEKR